MPPSNKPAKQKSLHQLSKSAGPYPPEAYEFVQHGLSYTVQKVHGSVADPEANRHVNGQQLSEGLREFALMQWGLLARIVLRRWNINGTIDFGRIVFALIDGGHMQRTEDDRLEDFEDVFSFKSAFETGYRIQWAS